MRWIRGVWVGGLMLMLVLLAALAWGRFGAVPADRWSLWLNGAPLGRELSLQEAEAYLTDRLNLEADQVVTLTAAGQQWPFSRRALGLPGAPPDLTERLRRAAGAAPWYHRWLGLTPHLSIELSLEPDPARLTATLAPLRATLERPAQSAALKVEAGAPVLVPEVPGQMIDQAALARALWAPEAARAAAEDRSARIEIPLVAVAPALTAADLAPLIEQGPLATWSTYYDPAIPRAENVERAADALSGILLQPGQILSYNGQVGPVSAEEGWQTAPVFAGGQIVTGVGGGLCQVATTLYGAALRAGLEILERHPHQLAVTYIPLGEDAAVAPGFQDLRLRNPGPRPLFLTAQASGGRVTFQVWGAPKSGRSYVIESRTTGQIPYPTITRIDPSLADGSQRVLTTGRPGYTAEAYRVLLQDGQVLRRELLSHDRYEPVTEVLLVGSVGSSPDADYRKAPVKDR
ncbi:MAG TPA: VanW family protein [Symbiobacteriaceae bacterium]|nr:VanW family protein [Symbiobacteriaceae bacterium]